MSEDKTRIDAEVDVYTDAAVAAQKTTDDAANQAELDVMGKGLDAADATIVNLEAKIVTLEARIATLEERIATLESQLGEP
jgi:predicted  nucleic acid-binding Zn-ribbon protein